LQCRQAVALSALHSEWAACRGPDLRDCRFQAALTRISTRPDVPPLSTSSQFFTSFYAQLTPALSRLTMFAAGLIWNAIQATPGSGDCDEGNTALARANPADTYHRARQSVARSGSRTPQSDACEDYAAKPW